MAKILDGSALVVGEVTRSAFDRATPAKLISVNKIPFCIDSQNNIQRLKNALSVDAFGAVGDGVTDDTASIQAAIDAATVGKASGGQIFFPPGEYLVGALSLGSATGGGVFSGSGVYRGDPRGGTRTGPHTILIWNGALGGTLLKDVGGSGWKIEHMTLVGRESAVGANRAAIGYKSENNASFGNFVGTFEHVCFVDFDAAVQMADVSGDSNCADIIFNHITLDSCTEGLVVNNTNGVNYLFNHLGAVDVDQVFNFVQGGSLTVNVANFSSCGGTGADQWMMRFDNLNDGVGNVQINGLRIEQNSQQLLKASVLGHVVFNGLEEAQTDQNETMFDVDGVVVTINDSRLITNDTTNPCFDLARGAGGQRSGLFLNRVHFDVAAWAFDDWFKWNTNHDVPLVTHGCSYQNTGVFLEDIISHLEYGDVTHFAQTTNATQTALYLNGNASASISNICRVPTDSVVRVTVQVVGLEVGGGVDIGSFVRMATFSNKSDVVALEGSVETIGTDINSDTWGGVTLAAVDSLDGFRVLVTGKASTTINWRARISAAVLIEH